MVYYANVNGVQTAFQTQADASAAVQQQQQQRQDERQQQQYSQATQQAIQRAQAQGYSVQNLNKDTQRAIQSKAERAVLLRLAQQGITKPEDITSERVKQTIGQKDFPTAFRQSIQANYFPEISVAPSVQQEINYKLSTGTISEKYLTIDVARKLGFNEAQIREIGLKQGNLSPETETKIVNLYKSKTDLPIAVVRSDFVEGKQVGVSVGKPIFSREKFVQTFNKEKASSIPVAEVLKNNGKLEPSINIKKNEFDYSFLPTTQQLKEYGGTLEERKNPLTNVVKIVGLVPNFFVQNSLSAGAERAFKATNIGGAKPNPALQIVPYSEYIFGYERAIPAFNPLKEFNLDRKEKVTDSSYFQTFYETPDKDKSLSLTRGQLAGVTGFIASTALFEIAGSKLGSAKKVGVKSVSVSTELGKVSGDVLDVEGIGVGKAEITIEKFVGKPVKSFVEFNVDSSLTAFPESQLKEAIPNASSSAILKEKELLASLEKERNAQFNVFKNQAKISKQASLNEIKLLTENKTQLDIDFKNLERIDLTEKPKQVSNVLEELNRKKQASQNFANFFGENKPSELISSGKSNSLNFSNDLIKDFKSKKPFEIPLEPKVNLPKSNEPLFSFINIEKEEGLKLLEKVNEPQFFISKQKATISKAKSGLTSFNKSDDEIINQFVGKGKKTEKFSGITSKLVKESALVKGIAGEASFIDSSDLLNRRTLTKVNEPKFLPKLGGENFEQFVFGTSKPNLSKSIEIEKILKQGEKVYNIKGFKNVEADVFNKQPILGTGAISKKVSGKQFFETTIKTSEKIPEAFEVTTRTSYKQGVGKIRNVPIEISGFEKSTLVGINKDIELLRNPKNVSNLGEIKLSDKDFDLFKKQKEIKKNTELQRRLQTGRERIAGEKTNKLIQELESKSLESAVARAGVSRTFGKLAPEVQLAVSEGLKAVEGSAKSVGFASGVGSGFVSGKNTKSIFREINRSEQDLFFAGQKTNERFNDFKTIGKNDFVGRRLRNPEIVLLNQNIKSPSIVGTKQSEFLLPKLIVNVRQGINEIPIFETGLKQIVGNPPIEIVREIDLTQTRTITRTTPRTAPPTFPFFDIPLYTPFVPFLPKFSGKPYSFSGYPKFKQERFRLPKRLGARTIPESSPLRKVLYGEKNVYFTPKLYKQFSKQERTAFGFQSFPTAEEFASFGRRRTKRRKRR